MTHRQEEPLCGPEEPATVRDTRFGEYVIEVEAQGAAEHEVLPVIATAQGGHELIGNGRPKPETDLVGGSNHGYRLLVRADPRHENGRSRAVVRKAIAPILPQSAPIGPRPIHRLSPAIPVRVTHRGQM